MKKLTVLFSAIFIVLVLAACGDNGDTNDVADDEVTEEDMDVADDSSSDVSDVEEDASEKPSSDNADVDVSDESSDQDDMKKMMDALNFDEIEIEVSYEKDKEYKAEIDYRDNGDVEAEIEDELNGVDIDDDLEAFNKLYPLVKQLDIKQDTNKDEVIKQVLDIFELEDDYKEFEVEIMFEDGTKLSYED